jgi:hypothetical protein
MSLEIKLSSLSPLSFEFAKAGDIVSLVRKKANKKEFRASIGAAVDSILVFRGQTKIGMIPIKTGEENAAYLADKVSAKVTKSDAAKKLLVIAV